MVPLAGNARKRAGADGLCRDLRGHVLASPPSAARETARGVALADPGCGLRDRSRGLVWCRTSVRVENVLPLLYDRALLRIGRRRRSPLVCAVPSPSGKTMATGETGLRSPAPGTKIGDEWSRRSGTAGRRTIGSFTAAAIHGQTFRRQDSNGPGGSPGHWIAGGTPFHHQPF